MEKYYWVDALSLRRPGGQNPVVCLKTTTGLQDSSLSSFIPNHDSYVSGDSTISSSNYSSSVNYFACLTYPLPQNNTITKVFKLKFYSIILNILWFNATISQMVLVVLKWEFFISNPLKMALEKVDVLEFF